MISTRFIRFRERIPYIDNIFRSSLDLGKNCNKYKRCDIGRDEAANSLRRIGNVVFY